MVLFIGYLLVFLSVVVGLHIGQSNLFVLWHVGEFVLIGGISLGVLVIASPMSVLKAIVRKIVEALKGGAIPHVAYSDGLKLLYQFFMLSRKEGLTALEEHITDPKASPICQAYPSIVNNPNALRFITDCFRPVVDGAIKPEQLRSVINAEVGTIEKENSEPVHVLALVGDSLPGIGICAAVLGIILTMGHIAEGPSVVGYKVAAALTGTFLGVYLAYGFVNPLTALVEKNNAAEERYYRMLGEGIVSFASGMPPKMAVEMARRTLLTHERPTADALEESLKGLPIPSR